jgi:bifunctional NMN adenylyltransferase/nudix hydrolase
MAVKKVAVYIGRFQPLHNGHTHIIDAAFKDYDALIVLVGSSNQAREVRNPFSFEERERMIRAYRNEYNGGAGILFVRPLYNFLYNNAKWIQYVQETVNRVIDEGGWKNVEVTIVGSDRDDTTWYVHAFPQWKQHLFPKVPEGQELSATNLRHRLFQNAYTESWDDAPSTTLAFLQEFIQTPEYKQLRREYDNAEAYKRQFGRGEIDNLIARYQELDLANPTGGWDMPGIIEDLQALRNNISPYPPVFVTTDSVVIQSGHILVIVRGALPGEGLWALPGGFLAGRLRLKANAVKEVMEETGIRLADGKRAEELTKQLLEKSIVASQTFDDPDRSSRGRTVTTAFLIRLDDTKPLPKVHGMFAPLEDTGGVEGVVETTNAMWVPISEARNRREMWFEDHWSILDAMLGMVKDN